MIRINRKYAEALLIGVVLIIIAMVLMLWPKKEFPVKVGQVWQCRMEMIPYFDNRPQQETAVVSYDSVYDIDRDGIIYYIKNGQDSMSATLEQFTFKSQPYKK